MGPCRVDRIRTCVCIKPTSQMWRETKLLYYPKFIFQDVNELIEPSVGFEPTCPFGSCLQDKCNQPLCEEGIIFKIFHKKKHPNLLSLSVDLWETVLPIIYNYFFIYTHTKHGATGLPVVPC